MKAFLLGLVGAVFGLAAFFAGTRFPASSPPAAPRPAPPSFQLLQFKETGFNGDLPILVRFDARTGAVERWNFGKIALSEEMRKTHPDIPSVMAEGWDPMAGTFFDSMSAMSKFANGEK